jgi:K+-transporting ATPase ATPase C chain
MRSIVRPAAVLLLVLTVITGAVYPAVVTGLARLLFPAQAAGSILEKDGEPIGSQLIGQGFTDPTYFWSRPSATGTMPYNGLASGGSNQGPLNPALTDAVKARVDSLRAADRANKDPVPIDLVTASASGLDPEISVAAAYYQVARIARTRGITPQAVKDLIASHTEGRLLGIIGEPRVNVLELNLALDAPE